MIQNDLVGSVFGRLTVVSRAEGIGPRKRSAWNCHCSCGKDVVIKAEHLLRKTNGNKDGTKSCGCLTDEKRKERAKAMYSTRIKYTYVEASAQMVWRKRYRDGDLSFESFMKLSQMNCYYCDAAPNNKQNVANNDRKASRDREGAGDFVYNGLDRIDSSMPHNELNLVPCCKYCNYAKRERTQEEFIEWITDIYTHSIKNKKGREIDSQPIHSI